MTLDTRRVAALVVATAVAACCCSCSSGSSVSFSNNASERVTIEAADQSIGDVEPGGGTIINTDDCIEGPFDVTYADGHTVSVDEAVCEGQQMLITNDDIQITSQPS